MKKIAVCGAVVVALLVGAWFARRTERPVVSLPATITTHGVRITLKSVTRASAGKLKVVVEMKYPPAPVLGGAFMEDFLTSPTSGCDCTGSCISAAHYPNRVVCTQTVKTGAGLERVTLCPGFEIRRKSKRVDANMKNIDVKSLPVTRTFNGIEVTVCHVYPSTHIDGAEWQEGFCNVTPGDKPYFYYTVEVAIRARGDFHSDDGFSSVQLRDDKGRIHDMVSSWYPLCGMPFGALEAESSPTVAEQVVGKVSPRLGERISQANLDKALDQERSAMHTWPQLFAFRRISPPPSRISFVLTGHYEPDPDDIIHVTFPSVPIPR